ncbi:MAG: exodeoxyribonuclease V subunit gamma [Arhodomonas sp.]|nr:exodeoxyribonuclease V subunit gamma [Arhodomonas sp.]
MVVPHASMSHWLSLTLAERQGILANVDFPFLGGLVWRLFCRHWPELPQQPPFDREALRWRLLELVPELLDEPSLAPPRAYLADAEHPGQPRLPARRPTGRPDDQYLVYRPDWIRQWEDGAKEPWQAVLAAAACRHGEGRDRAQLLATYIGPHRRSRGYRRPTATVVQFSACPRRGRPISSCWRRWQPRIRSRSRPSTLACTTGGMSSPSAAWRRCARALRTARPGRCHRLQHRPPAAVLAGAYR